MKVNFNVKPDGNINDSEIQNNTARYFYHIVMKNYI